MKALVWMGKKKVEVQSVDDPAILNPRDCIVKITSTAICGSDIHLFNGYIPTLEKGDILGHEFMGEVVETGPAVKRIKVGDRVDTTTVVCIIEAMKVFNEIPAETRGQIVAVLAADGEAVDFEKPLFKVDTSK